MVAASLRIAPPVLEPFPGPLFLPKARRSTRRSGIVARAAGSIVSKGFVMLAQIQGAPLSGEAYDRRLLPGL